MLKDFVSLYEYVKELLEYTGADNVSEEELGSVDKKYEKREKDGSLA
ncbi:hypothetical protein [Wolbachia endosymbiont (group A) of Trypoxylon clavicerum]|nr:hypothetical protein [Wolbachia endosymbiont (group A) of Trypoxylon clavicerum]